MMTKGKMIKELKAKGVRHGEKNGAKVQLEHLKSFQVTEMYYTHCK